VPIDRAWGRLAGLTPARLLTSERRLGYLVAVNGVALFFCAAAVITAVTAVLNLDTTVAFLTAVLIHSARNRRSGEQPLMAARWPQVTASVGDVRN
jgi:peptidoglycan/LPS O-acetylase OafA/YrhL